jgi:hypothetical protein
LRAADVRRLKTSPVSATKTISAMIEERDI